MAMAIFWLTQLTYQNRPIVNLFNFCFFHPILIRFGLGGNFGLKRTWNKFEIHKALCRPKADPRRSLWRTKACPQTALFSRIYIYISLFIQPYTQEVSQKIYPEKSGIINSIFCPEKGRIINSIFLAILDIEGFPFFLADVWESCGTSGAAWGLGRNLYPK